MQEKSSINEDIITKTPVSKICYHKLFETARDGIFLVDFETGVILDINKFLLDLLGYSKADFLKKHFWEIPIFKGIVASKASFSAFREKKFIHFEDFPLTTKNGENFDVEFVANICKVNGSKIIHCNIRDITDRKEVQGKLEKSEKLFRQMFENMTSGVVIYEPIKNGTDFILREFNKASERIEKVKRRDVVGQSVLKVFPGVKDFGLFRTFQRVWKTGIAERFQTSLYKDERISGWRDNYVYRLPDGKIIAVYNDVSEKVWLKELTKISELRYRRLFETAKDGILLIDFQTGMILDANKFLIDLLDYSKDDFLNKHLWEVGVFKDIAASKENFETLQKKRYVRFEDLPLETKNGKEIAVEFVANAYQVGKELVIQCNIRDITERKKAEKKLRMSEDKYHKIFESSPYVLTMTQIEDGKFIEVNDAFVSMSGYGRKEALSSTSAKLNIWGDKKNRKMIVSRLRAGLPVKDLEFEFRTKSGEKKTGLYSAELIELSQGLCILSSIVDITERKKTQRLIADIKIRDEAMLDSIGDAVFATDRAGKVLLFNKMAEKMTGVSAKKAIGKYYKEVVAFTKEETGEPSEGFIEEAILEDKITKMSNHVELVRKDGTKIPVADSAAPIKNTQGEIVGCVVIFHDVTQERQVDKAKTEFVSLASHQLRTPLSTVNWYVEMLLSLDVGELTSKQKQYSEQIRKASLRMVNLVNALLNVSRLELGTFAINPERVDIKKVAESCLDELKLEILKKKLVVSQKYDKGVTFIKADVQLLTIIFQNLLSNSVKYTGKNGKVGLEVTKEKDGILIKVSDNGIGIPKYQQKEIFEKLFRADNAKITDPDGTGLGLYIVKKIINYTGGEVWFKSIENKGTTFYVKLHLAGMTKKVGDKTLI